MNNYYLVFVIQALKLGENIFARANVVLHKEWLQPSNDLFLSSTQLCISKKAKTFIHQRLEIQSDFLEALEIYNG
jgi:hypothetical protein